MGYFSVFWLVLVSIERINQTLETVFDISKHLVVRKKYSAARRIFNSLPGVSKCSQTRSFVFDVLLLINSSERETNSIYNLPMCFKWNQISRKTHERRFNLNMNENICGGKKGLGPVHP